MVSDVIEFSTNQKTVNFFMVFQRYLGNGKEFLDEIFCIAFRKIFRIFYKGIGKQGGTCGWYTDTILN